MDPKMGSNGLRMEQGQETPSPTTSPTDQAEQMLALTARSNVILLLMGEGFQPDYSFCLTERSGGEGGNLFLEAKNPVWSCFFEAP